MRIEKRDEKEVIEIQEDVRVPGTDIILEKGDKIQVFEAEVEETEDQPADEE